ncbi:MAG: S8 family serine peptidase [Clostridia bacterium]|nr:S8 family serine peptidase [Clostridia bacterium]
MFNIKDKCWKSEKYAEAEKVFHREQSAKGAPASMFAMADMLLENAERGKQNADAVYLMESAAKADHPMAAYSLAQMFHYGWAVGKSKKLAIVWYEKAAELGNADAQAILERLKAEKKRNTALVIVSVILAVLLAAAATLFILFGLGDGDKKDKDKEKESPKAEPVVGVIVGDNTELHEEEDAIGLSEDIWDMVEEYGPPDENGRTYRLMVWYSGGGIDLSQINAEHVMAYGDEIVFLQFKNAEDTDAAKKLLSQMDCVVSFAEDSLNEVNTNLYGEVEPSDLSSSGIPYTSSYSGFTYITWGAEYMGMDQYAAWLMNRPTSSVIVAVLDTGSEPWPGYEDRYLEGADISRDAYPNGQYDIHGHGSHVAGTIIDCTQGLDVSILPVKSLNTYDYGTEEEINKQYASIWSTAMFYAEAEGASVFNMSIGITNKFHTTPEDTCGNLIDIALDYVTSKGVVVAVAAGNDSRDCGVECPAHNGKAIIVSAFDEYGDLAYFTNFGDGVDVGGPGVDVGSYLSGGEFGYLSGTSMAAPHIAALAAMIKAQYPDTTSAEVEKYITVYSVDMGKESSYGAGIPWAGYFAGE